MKSLLETCEAELAVLEDKHLRRSLRLLEGIQRPEMEINGRKVIQFSSNDYLGLSGEPFLREAFQEASERFGVGSGGSRLISGTNLPHCQLEDALAGFKQTDAALAFSCGYSTALGVLPALAGKDDVIIMDKLSHACLVDGAKLSRAILRIFPHNDLDKLESHLKWAREKYPSARIIILTESVFSMDGDVAPLREIVDLKDQYGAWLFVDEAHGIGVIGEEGRGLVDTLGLGGRVEIQMGTLGKALGVAGGYIAGSKPLVDLLVNRSRSFIFSTSPPPAQAAAALAAIRWLPTKEGKARIARLTENRRLFAEICAAISCIPPAAIVPIPVGEEWQTLDLASKLFHDGIFVPAVRYPAVRRGEARLRLTLTALHRKGHLQAFASVLARHWAPADR